ncbi:MAG: O-antigen ligase family protein [Planctomycetes bacterium]|nr:O-antigen ligase family protein [Planctomycetota bacterium]
MARLVEPEPPPPAPPRPWPERLAALWPWLATGILVLPCHPHWVDFEQARRGLWLLLAGLVWLCAPGLPRVRGEAAFWAFFGALAVAAVISVRSLQPFEALYRGAHWLALLVWLRAVAGRLPAFGAPLATVLLLTSLFGLLQRAGLAELAGYGVEREPVASFGNLNVASEWTALAATATAVLGTQRAWLGQLAVALAAAYLWVNGSRSGLYALPIGLCLLCLLRPRAGAVWLLLAVAGGALGFAADQTLPRPAPAESSGAAADLPRGEKTLAVRWEIAKSCTRLFAERPLFGFGPGQFAVQYPRVRSAEEIELSGGRRFATEVRTAHDDWLELLVEGGVPLLLLFAALLFALQRGKRDQAALLPLFVLLLLMFVRAPLGNAPALLAAFVPVAARAPEWRPAPAWTRWLLRGLGLVLLGLGLLPLVGQTAAAAYVRARAQGELPPLTALHTARRWQPFEPRWLQLLAQEELGAGDLAAARRHAARAVQLRPHDPQLLLLLGEVLARGSAYDLAAQIATQGLQHDPQNPELRVLLSTVQFQRGDVEAAITTVLDQPHTVLRERLPTHFRDLERLAVQAGKPEAAARCAFERLCLDALGTLAHNDANSVAETEETLKLLLDAAQRSGLAKRDLRPYLLSALHWQRRGEPDTVQRLGERAAALQLSLPPWQRAQLGPLLAPLRELPSWRPLLR